MKRTSKRVMAVAVSLAMVLTGSTSALAATTNPEISDREIWKTRTIPCRSPKKKEPRSHFLVRAYTIPSKEVPVPVQ